MTLICNKLLRDFWHIPSAQGAHGDIHLLSSSCPTAPPEVRDALGYVQLLFLQFCVGQGRLDSVPGASYWKIQQ